MKLTDFIDTLLAIAKCNDLRLHMRTAIDEHMIGFCFEDDRTGRWSNPVRWYYDNEEPRVIFDKLNELAKEFVGGLNG